MGKVLVIKGADFSENAVEQISFADYLPINRSQFKVLFLDYSGASIRLVPSSASDQMKIFVADVSSYIGRTIRITSANQIISNAYYCCFTASLGSLNFSEIPSLSGAAVSEMVTYPIVPIESFNVSSVSQQKATIEKTIPNGASYLIVTGDFGGNLTQSDFKAELVSE